MNLTDSYWKVTDQVEKLQELISAEHELKDRPQRRDVRSLGNLLGIVILEQAGQAVYDLEESLRILSIAHRERERVLNGNDLQDLAEHDLLQQMIDIVTPLNPLATPCSKPGVSFGERPRQ